MKNWLKILYRNTWSREHFPSPVPSPSSSSSSSSSFPPSFLSSFLPFFLHSFRSFLPPFLPFLPSFPSVPFFHSFPPFLVCFPLRLSPFLPLFPFLAILAVSLSFCSFDLFFVLFLFILRPFSQSFSSLYPFPLSLSLSSLSIPFLSLYPFPLSLSLSLSLSIPFLSLSFDLLGSFSSSAASSSFSCLSGAGGSIMGWGGLSKGFWQRRFDVATSFLLDPTPCSISFKGDTATKKTTINPRPHKTNWRGNHAHMCSNLCSREIWSWSSFFFSLRPGFQRSMTICVASLLGRNFGHGHCLFPLQTVKDFFFQGPAFPMRKVRKSKIPDKRSATEPCKHYHGVFVGKKIVVGGVFVKCKNKGGALENDSCPCLFCEGERHDYFQSSLSH